MFDLMEDIRITIRNVFAHKYAPLQVKLEHWYEHHTFQHVFKLQIGHSSSHTWSKFVIDDGALISMTLEDAITEVCMALNKPLLHNEKLQQKLEEAKKYVESEEFFSIGFASGGALNVQGNPLDQQDAYNNSGVELAQLLPGLSATVKCPDCGRHGNLSATIIHLNDDVKWTREQIADWLESLPSEIDLTFKEKVND